MGRRLKAFGVRRFGVVAAIAASAATCALTPVAHADPITDTATEQSCRALYAGTAGIQDLVQADLELGGERAWPPAPPGLLPPHLSLRTSRDSFNRRFQFATRAGKIYMRPNDNSGEPWREMPLPLCFAGRVSSISVDDDELIALDSARRVYTMDNALKEPALFNWTARWGPPFWTGPGYQLPADLRAWSWSVISPVEDVAYTDSAGNHPPVGSSKVSHIWALRADGRRLTFWDPWLPPDDSNEMCGPYRGRFKALNLSTSGSTIFVIGSRGDMFTRLFDFDLSGHDPFFLKYSYEDQRGKGDSAPIQLPPPGWIHQPKIPGRITSAISIEKVGRNAVHRTLRVEGLDRRGRTGYWEKDITQASPRAWRFHRTGEPLRAREIANPRSDTSTKGLAPAEDLRFAGRAADMTAEVPNFNVYCSPARLRIHPARGRPFDLVLHNIDGLRQSARARGLDDVPREQYGDIEVPAAAQSNPAARAFVQKNLGGRRFTDVTLEVTAHALQIKELGWSFAR